MTDVIADEHLRQLVIEWTNRKILLVKNLPLKIKAEEVYDLFGQYGPVWQIRVGKSI